PYLLLLRHPLRSSLFPYTTLFRSLVVVHVLDRVLDRDDVAAGLLVAVVQHRCERGGLTRAGAADDDDQAALAHDDVLENRRQLQDRKSTRLNSSHVKISYAVFCLK